MELVTYEPGNYLTIRRGTGKRVNNESGVFYQLKLLLNSSDGEWVKVNKVPGLNGIFYALRTRKGETYIYDNYYATRAIERDFNAGKYVVLFILK